MKTLREQLEKSERRHAAADEQVHMFPNCCKDPGFSTFVRFS